MHRYGSDLTTEWSQPTISIAVEQKPPRVELKAVRTTILVPRAPTGGFGMVIAATGHVKKFTAESTAAAGVQVDALIVAIGGQPVVGKPAIVAAIQGSPAGAEVEFTFETMQQPPSSAPPADSGTVAVSVGTGENPIPFAHAIDAQVHAADPLTEFCALNKFAAFELALLEMGIAEPSELADATDAELTAIGFNNFQLKRLRRLIPARSAAATVVPNATTPLTQPAVDQSVDVTTAIGGAE